MSKEKIIAVLEELEVALKRILHETCKSLREILEEMREADCIKENKVIGEYFPHPEQLLSGAELKRYTHLTRRFWEGRRFSGDGPKFIRFSAKCVRYRWGDVCKWLEDRERTSTSDQGKNK